MTVTAIRPPVSMRDGRSISTLPEATGVVRDYAIAHRSLIAAVLLRRLEGANSDDDVQALALEFRSWAAREGLLLTHPPRRAKSAAA